MMIVRERAGDTLIGPVDGINQTFQVTLDYNPDRVALYRNGLLVDPDRDRGYTLAPPRGMVLVEAPRVGDTIEIEYMLAEGTRTGGGAEGGVPDAPQLQVLAPETTLDAEDVPAVGSEVLEPVGSTDEDRPALFSEPLVPVIVSIDDGG